MTYAELKEIFRELKRLTPTEDLTAHIVFTESSFAAPYTRLARTYSVSSDNKAFWSRMGGYSIFAYCLDKTSDQGVRLDWYMVEEGNADGWAVEDCYILERMRDAAAVPCCNRTEQPDGTICYFFGDTCIKAREIVNSGKISLEPVEGDQAACGEWTDLPIDRVYAYCTLLERHLNAARSGPADGKEASV